MEKLDASILVVEDDLDVAEMLRAFFSVQGYEVATVNWGEDAVTSCYTNPPNLVILDIRLPDINGFEVARRLRENRRTHNIPIIFLTERAERDDRIRGLELQADDYITKPFDIDELMLRVSNAINRASRTTLTNPITGLPEGKLVDEFLQECLQVPGIVLIIAELEQYNQFRDSYGFMAADDVLRAMSLLLKDIVLQCRAFEGFLGHLSSETFLLATTPSRSAETRQRIKQLEPSLAYFYHSQDAQPDAKPLPQVVFFTDEVTISEDIVELEQLKMTLARFTI